MGDLVGAHRGLRRAHSANTFRLRVSALPENAALAIWRAIGRLAHGGVCPFRRLSRANMRQTFHSLMVRVRGLIDCPTATKRKHQPDIRLKPSRT